MTRTLSHCTIVYRRRNPSEKILPEVKGTGVYRLLEDDDKQKGLIGNQISWNLSLRITHLSYLGFRPRTYLISYIKNPCIVSVVIYLIFTWIKSLFMSSYRFNYICKSTSIKNIYEGLINGNRTIHKDTRVNQ